MSFSPSGSPNALAATPRGNFESGTGGLVGSPGGGKGGSGQPAQQVPAPSQTQYAPMQQPSAPVQQSSGPNVYQQSASALTGAQQAASGLANFAPVNMQSATGGGGSRISAPDQIAVNQLASTDLSQYMNPYTQNVIDQGQADIERQRQMASNSMGAQAEAANAYGGSRQAVQEGVLAGEAARQAGQLSAQQRQASFNQALASGQFDIGQTQAARTLGSQQALQADMSNQASSNQASLAAAAREQAANMANYQGQFQAANIQSNAANQLGNLAQTGFGFGQQIGQNQMQQGLLQQGMQQQLIDAARGQYQNAINAPMQSLNAPLTALGQAKGPQTTTDSKNPGLLNYIQAIGSICWVAREVYGEDNPKWLQFREWVIGYSPNWFYKAYSKYGEKMAAIVAKVPALKAVIRPFMDAKRKALGYK